MNAIQKLEVLEVRDARLCRAMDTTPPTSPRYGALNRARIRTWQQLRTVGWEAHWERVDQEWPQGMPAHP